MFIPVSDFVSWSRFKLRCSPSNLPQKFASFSFDINSVSTNFLQRRMFAGLKPETFPVCTFRNVSLTMLSRLRATKYPCLSEPLVTHRPSSHLSPARSLSSSPLGPAPWGESRLYGPVFVDQPAMEREAREGSAQHHKPCSSPRRAEQAKNPTLPALTGLHDLSDRFRTTAPT